MLSESEIIQRYFQRKTLRPDVRLGIGDDAAVLVPRAGQDLLVTTDTLVVGIHFLRDADPFLLGHKSLAVNLSDLAAMGAAPAYVCLALTIPEVDEHWLEEFSAGFFALADQHAVALVGGDLTRGPLSITVQAMGYAPAGTAIRRSGARPGDLIYVTGTLGDAALGLAQLREEMQFSPDVSAHCLARLHKPTPRIAVGIALRELASAACDISDGLGCDLNRVLMASGVGARVELADLPLSAAFRRSGAPLSLAISGGDDYELIFTATAADAEKIAQLGPEIGSITVIGNIEKQPGLRFLLNGRPSDLDATGFDHFG